MTGRKEALLLVLAMGAVILFCRVLPFLLFSRGSFGDSAKRSKTVDALLGFVEKVVPPAAMTVLAFNALAGAFKENTGDGLFVLAASAFTALLHLWKRNSLISILGGTTLYMLLGHFR